MGLDDVMGLVLIVTWRASAPLTASWVALICALSRLKNRLLRGYIGVIELQPLRLALALLQVPIAGHAERARGAQPSRHVN